MPLLAEHQIAGLTLMGLAAAWSLFFWHLRGRVGRARGWPVLDGRITRSAVVEVTRTDYRRNPFTLRSERRLTPVYKVIIEYAYLLDGRPIAGETVRAGQDNCFPNAKKAQQLRARYPVGRQVGVFLDPKAGRRTCLERETPGVLAGALGAAAFALLGVVLFSGLIPAEVVAGTPALLP